MKRVHRKRRRRLALEWLERRNLLAGANLGFETVEPIGTSWPNQFNDWNGDRATIVESENGIVPYAGARMLRFDYAAPRPYTATNLAGSQTEQLMDASLFGDVRSGTATVTATAWFNRVAGDSHTDTQFSIYLSAYSGSPSSYPRNKENKDGFLKSEVVEVFTDDDPRTWEMGTVSLTLPSNTSFISLQLIAVENIYNDYSGVEFDGHYADRVTLAGQNNSPTLDFLADLKIDEDSPDQIVELTGITSGDTETLPLRVTAISSDTSLISAPIVTYLSPETKGSLKITPMADQSGSAIITVTVEDAGWDGDFATVIDNKATQRQFTITVVPVNDAPRQTKSLANAAIEATRAIDIAFAQDLFVDPENDAITYSAELQAGSSLPAWLIFDADARRFTGNAPFDALGTWVVRVNATDSSYPLERASTTFDLVIIDPAPWHNRKNSHDVDDSGNIEPLDALMVINLLNHGKGGLLPAPPSTPLAPALYIDVSADNYLTPLDALLVINFINRRLLGEGETTSSDDEIAEALNATWGDDSGDGRSRQSLSTSGAISKHLPQDVSGFQIPSYEALVNELLTDPSGIQSFYKLTASDRPPRIRRWH